MTLRLPTVVISFDLLTGDIPHHSPKLHTSLRWEESYLHPTSWRDRRQGGTRRLAWGQVISAMSFGLMTSMLPRLRG